MRKTTAFGRKLKRAGGAHFNSAAWANVIQMSRPYEAAVPVVIPGLIADARVLADCSLENVKKAYASMLQGSGTNDDFDLLSWSFGTACFRAGQIGGESLDQNALLPPLIEGNVALGRVLKRHERFGKWQLLSVDILAIDYAVEVYGTILLASSPLEMGEADEMHSRWLKGRTLQTAN